MIRLYSSGKSIREIRDCVGVSRERVRMVLHSNGIRMRHVHAVYHEPTFELDNDGALLLGLHAGDGYLSDAWGLSINERDIRMGRCVTSLVRRILGVEPYIERRKDGYFVVKTGKKQAIQFFERFGYTRGRKAATVEVPKEVMSSKDAEV